MKILKLLLLVSLLAACKAETGLENAVVITEHWVRENAPGQSEGAAWWSTCRAVLAWPRVAQRCLGDAQELTN